MKRLRRGLVLGCAAMLTACAEETRAPAGDAPAVPLQAARLAQQAPIVTLDGRMHVGADVAAPAGGLPQVARHGEARVSHGSIADGIGAAEVTAYLRADAASYLDPGEEAGTEDELVPGGLVFRFAAEPPTVRVAEGTSPELLDETVRVVQAINAALPEDWQLRFGGAFVPAETTEAPDGEILVTLAPQAEWSSAAMPTAGEDIGLAEPRYAVVTTGDPEIPLRIDIVAGRVWTDPAQTEGLERLGVIAHELIHLLGRGHVDPDRFPATLMVSGGSEALTAHILHPLDREALLAAYDRLPPGISPDRIAAELGPWSDTAMHIRGAIDVADAEVAFGAALRNGLAQPWAGGAAPDSSLEDNAALSGTVRWSGRLLGLTPRAETVAGAADLAVDLGTLSGALEFSELEHWPAAAAPGPTGSGTTWRDGRLGYEIEVRGNSFIQTGGDAGRVTGAFFGPAHEGMGGVVVREDLSAGFGGKR